MINNLELSDFDSLMIGSVGHLKKLVHVCISSIFAEVVTYSTSAKNRLFESVLQFSSDILNNCWDFLNLNADAQTMRNELIRALIITNVEENCPTFKKASDLLLELSQKEFSSSDLQKFTPIKLPPLSGGEVITSISHQIIKDIASDINKSLLGCRGEFR